jgi:hypothetical protein
VPICIPKDGLLTEFTSHTLLIYTDSEERHKKEGGCDDHHAAADRFPTNNPFGASADFGRVAAQAFGHAYTQKVR